MSIDLKEISVTVKERTRLITISSPIGDDPIITIHRETVVIDQEGTIYKREDSKVVSKRLSEIMSAKVGDMTGAEFAGMISQVADDWSR